MLIRFFLQNIYPKTRKTPVSQITKVMPLPSGLKINMSFIIGPAADATTWSENYYNP